jgi:hypothetical protein
MTVAGLGRSAIYSFYREGINYTFGRERYSPTFSHFTQLLWNASNTVGIATALRKLDIEIDGIWWEYECLYFITVYKPQGNLNYEKSFTDNVVPPLNGRTVAENLAEF